MKKDNNKIKKRKEKKGNTIDACQLNMLGDIQSAGIVKQRLG